MQTKFPTKPGWYWFYGWTSALTKKGIGDQERKPRLYAVRVVKISNGISYIADGHFMYKSEGGEGIWLKVNQPNMSLMDDLLENPSQLVHVAKRIERSAGAIKCPVCGGFAEKTDCTEEEIEKYQTCGKNYACCIGAFICCLCEKRTIAYLDSPEME